MKDLRKKLRSDAYEAQLTPDEVRELHTRLLALRVSLFQTREWAPPWRTGPFTGAKPCLATFSKMAARLRAEKEFYEKEHRKRYWRATAYIRYATKRRTKV